MVLKKIQESCHLFQINNLDEVDRKTLKRKYYKMCLKYHPDKNKNHRNEFTKIKECYETLNAYIDANEVKTPSPCSDTSQHEAENIYETLISLISVENIEYMIQLINSYKIYMNHSPEIITLNVTLKQVFDRCVFVSNENYIPLWHNIIHQFGVKEQKHIIFVTKICDIPSHIHILKNNDIVVQTPKKNIIMNEYNNIYICDQVNITVYISEHDYQKEFIILKHKGIPRTNINNIFDTSQISNIRLYLV